MTKFNLMLLFFAQLLLLIGTSSCEQLQPVKSLKLAHSLGTQHPVHLSMVFMAEKVREHSQGKLDIKIYPSQQLGTERQCLELLQIGSLAMTKVSAAVMENFSPNMQVFGLPYLFRDRNHSYQVLDGQIGKNLLIQSEKYWLRGLTYFDAGQRSFYSKAPIQTPADLENKKIRVMESATAMNLVRSMGGAPTPISWGELYTALQQGIVDGAENNPPSFFRSRHYEVCKYYTLNEHSSIPDILVIGTAAWNRLSSEEQGWLQAAADEAKNYQRQLWQEAENEALKAIAAAGVEIIRPDKSLFAQKTEALFDQYRDDPAKYQLIQDIRNQE